MNRDKYLQNVADDVQYCVKETDAQSFQFGKYGTKNMVQGLQKTIQSVTQAEMKNIASIFSTVFTNRLAIVNKNLESNTDHQHNGTVWRRLLYDAHATILSLQTCLAAPALQDSGNKKQTKIWHISENKHYSQIASIADETQADEAFALDQFNDIYQPGKPLNPGIMNIDNADRPYSYIIMRRKQMNSVLGDPHTQILDYGVSVGDAREALLQHVLYIEMLQPAKALPHSTRIETTGRLDRIAGTVGDWKKLVPVPKEREKKR